VEGRCLQWLLRCVPKDTGGKVFGLAGRLKVEDYVLVMATVWSRVTDACGDCTGDRRWVPRVYLNFFKGSKVRG